MPAGPFSRSTTITLPPTAVPVSPTTKDVHDHISLKTQSASHEDSNMEYFLREVKRRFEAPLELDNLLSMSSKLQVQFKEKLQCSNICMLPSYNHTLPTGHERGTYLTVDLGGSNLRVALVELGGKLASSERSSMEMVRIFTFRIDNTVRALEGQAFFAWMAEKIEEAIEDPQVKKVHGDGIFAMGIAWSFPVQQTSIRSGILLEMGKGFRATQEILGQDIGELVMRACRKRNLNVRVDAVINDGSATLLSRAYVESSTRFGLILGTGSNASVILPVSALAKSKFGDRPQSWHDQAKHVLVNTEFSMFGRGILPMTRWDEEINRTHMLPDFQPFEQLISGRYLGEIVRLILLEGIKHAGLFQGQIPERFLEPYALDTGTVALIEADESSCLTKATAILLQQHPLLTPPTPSDMTFVRQITQLVSHRAAALLATVVHALWSLRASAEGIPLTATGHVTIGCNGTVIERYPGFRALSQRYVDALTMFSGAAPNAVALEMAHESALFGAAVAVGCLEGQ